MKKINFFFVLFFLLFALFITGKSDFTPADDTFTPYQTLTFSGKIDVQADSPIIDDYYPANDSSNIEMFPLLNITIDEPQNDNFNITWTTNATSWTVYNSSCVDGSYTQRAVWANQSNTKYWWTVSINDTGGDWTNATYHFTTATYSWTNWSTTWTFNYSASAPSNFKASTYNKTVINLTWTTDATADTNVLLVNESGWNTYPSTVSNGTELYNGTLEAYDHTGLSKGTTYYYSIWSYNITENGYSLQKATASNTTDTDLGIQGPYPANESTGNDRPPTNISIGVNGSNIDVYIYYNNHTLRPDEFRELQNWTSQTTGRLEVSTLWENEFIWGGTRYNWSVNITNGVSWLNESFWYETKGSRYDIDNDDTVFVGDLNAVWANRATYDNLYDADDDGTIFVGDLNTVWANR